MQSRASLCFIAWIVLISARSPRSQEVKRASNGIKYVGERLNTETNGTTDPGDERPGKENANIIVNRKNQNIEKNKYTPMNHQNTKLTWLPSLVGAMLAPGSVCILAILLILKRTVYCHQRPGNGQEIPENIKVFDEDPIFDNV